MLYNLSSDGFDCPLSSVCSEGFEQSQYSYGGIGSFWLVWVAMLASAYVVGKKSHLCVTLLSDNLNEKGKLFLEIVVQVLFILFAAVIMIYGGWQASLVTMGQISPSLSIPMGYVYLSVPVSGAIMLLYSVMNLLDRTPRTVESEAE